MRGSSVTRCDQAGQYGGQASIAGETSLSFYIILSIAIICGWLQYYLEATSITVEVSDQFAYKEVTFLQLILMLIFSDIICYFRYVEN